MLKKNRLIVIITLLFVSIPIFSMEYFLTSFFASKKNTTIQIEQIPIKGTLEMEDDPKAEPFPVLNPHANNSVYQEIYSTGVPLYRGNYYQF